MKKYIKNLLVMCLAIILFAAIPAMQGEAAAGLNKGKATVYVGGSTVLKLNGTSGGETWSSSNRSVAVVDQKGKVTGKKAGTAIITARLDNESYKCRITVKKPYLNAVKKTMVKGKSFTLKLTGTKAASFRSNNRTVASVTSKGKVTAKKKGKAVIFCKGRDKKTYKCSITVKEKAGGGLSAQKVYADMMAMKSKYPEGMRWTNANFYAWKGGIYSGGSGCAGFAFALSDAAFGSLPARQHKDFSKIRVGDIVRLNNDTHSVIVLKVQKDGVTVAEGNYNSSVHWGREIKNSEIRSTGTYVLTRYPK